MKVLIVYDWDKYTRKEIISELHNSGFNYDFKLDSDIKYGQKDKFVMGSDEIWSYGYVDDKYIMVMANQIGKHVWEMC